MEKTHSVSTTILSVIITSLGIVSFSLCVASEFQRTKWEDLKLDGKLCYLPKSRAFRFGIVALICLCAAQIIGSLIVCRNFCSREKRITSCDARKPTIGCIFLFLSWISFVIALTLISVATSMNKRQPYGKGWLDGECYIVKDGVYLGAAFLVLVNVGSTLASAILTRRKREVDQAKKVYAQL
ncbi:hypothetical protein RHMOL_Rhmol11G0090500 [Rhododendron molle]|uniref:Uncharacterized protein n=1 Tax=Rhododendron molle TaxID=49168 RepID=A0ACC0LRQ7_RHOML|nr:hypothetical protein RHMOL_Rhmol11G0090500 [Rhododendron molle]